MFELWFWLIFLIFLFVAVIDFILYTDLKTAKEISLVFFISVFIVFINIFSWLDFSYNNFYSIHFELSKLWNITLIYGIDSISILFLLLTSFIFIVSLFVAWNSIKTKFKSFIILLILLEFFIINVFINFDLLFFYFWFESSLLPIFFIILIWGNNNRKIAAAFYLLMYTLLLSTPFFLSIIFLHFKVGTTNSYLLVNFIVLSESYQKFFFITFFLAFAVKLPIFPIHLWLPEAHVEAPTAGSLILASLLLKLGYYGFLRFVLQLFPAAIIFYKPVLATICILSCTYTAFISLSQFDLKKIIAYSSVSHMSLGLLGLFTGNFYGILGSLLLAVGHTFVSAALFILVGFIYDRYHTRIIDYYSGICKILPGCSTIFFSFLLSNFGFPISLNFIGEFLILIGVGSWNFYILLSLIIYSVLSVSYNLFLYVRVFHGSQKDFKVYDLTKIELRSIFPLVISNFWFFIKAGGLIKFITPAILILSV